MTPDLLRVRWHLDSDGGGEAVVAIDHKSHVEDQKYVFDSLDRADQLSAGIAAMIRADGRAEGELPVKP
jgi:hypothetical protein